MQPLKLHSTLHGIYATSQPLMLQYLLPYIQFVPESARFHVVNGRPDKAEDVIKRIAWFNCRDPPKVNSYTFEVFVVLHTLQWSTICYANGNVKKIYACLSVRKNSLNIHAGYKMYYSTLY